MEEVLSRCGYRCDLCLAYRPNVEAHPENRQLLSDGWHRYFGFRIPPDRIECDGCWSEGGRLIDPECPVRPCVIARSLENCAFCADYGCDKLKERLVEYEAIAAGVDDPIPAQDRACFLAPYENQARLERIRSERPA
jgi:hypothetical protein